MEEYQFHQPSIIPTKGPLDGEFLTRLVYLNDLLVSNLQSFETEYFMRVD